MSSPKEILGSTDLCGLSTDNICRANLMGFTRIYAP